MKTRMEPGLGNSEREPSLITEVDMNDFINFNGVNLVKHDYNILTGIAKEYFHKTAEKYFSNLREASKLVYLHVEDKRVRRLDMCSQSLIEVPKGIDKLVNLSVLSLSSNQIEDVSGLGNLVELERLYLGYNQIRDITGLGNLVNLELLGLSNNPNLDCNAWNNKKVIDELKERECEVYL